MPMNWPPTEEDWAQLRAIQAGIRRMETNLAKLRLDTAAMFIDLAGGREGEERTSNAREAFHMLADEQQKLTALPADRWHDGYQEQFDRIPDLIDAALDLAR